MASINLNSIISKAKSYMGTSQAQKQVEKYIDSAVIGSVTFGFSNGYITKTPQDAANKFIEVLQNEIMRNPKLVNISELLLNLSYSTPIKTGKNTYSIEVSFVNNLAKESLYPQEYGDGIQNIAALFNNGYSAKSPVYGYWHGNRIKSLETRNATNFIGNAIDSFMSLYSLEYGVLNIDASDIYG